MMTAEQAIQLAGYMYLDSRYSHAEKILLDYVDKVGDEPFVLFNLAILMSISGQFDRCTEYCERSLLISPYFHEARDLLAHQRLRDSRWEEGFELFESRFTKPHAIAYYNFACPVWDGQFDSCRKLLVWCEQGLGDTVQFSRLVQYIRKQGIYVLFLVQDELYDLYLESQLADEIHLEKNVVRYEETLTGRKVLDINTGFVNQCGVDAHIPVMSLARVLKIHPSWIPGATSFLRVSESRQIRANYEISRLCRGGSGSFRIGLVWSGSKSAHPEFLKTAKRRNVPLCLLKPILDIEGVDFFSLQMGYPEVEVLEFPQVLRPTLTQSYADTAALLQKMDLLITIDSSMAHVASALEIPVWLMNRYDSCWRWFRKEEVTPWYPTMRIFRQKSLGDWNSIVDEISDALQSILKSSYQKNKASGVIGNRNY